MKIVTNCENINALCYHFEKENDTKYTEKVKMWGNGMIKYTSVVFKKCTTN